MKVRDLLDRLADYSPDAEVRIMHQPRYPLESTLGGVVGESEIREHEGGDLGDDPEVVYLLEGSQVGYGRSGVGGVRVNPDVQAEYARLSALVRLRLDELEESLDRHEFAKRWGEAEVLVRVERGLAKLVEEMR